MKLSEMANTARTIIWIDYKKTYVKVSNEEELEKALLFYEEKFWMKREDVTTLNSWDIYVKCSWDLFLSNFRNKFDNIDITEEVLRPKTKFKVWDRVRIKKWSKDWADDMDFLIWVEATISKYLWKNGYGHEYELKDFSEKWLDTNRHYNEDMFDLVGKEEVKYAVHCKTEEEFRILQKVWTKKWYKLCSWASPMERNIWEQKRRNLCVSCENNVLWFDCIDYFKKWNYKILSFEEWMEKLWEKVEKIYYERAKRDIVYFNKIFFDDPDIADIKPIITVNTILNSKQPVKMNTLRELMFGTVDLKKLATLVETTEERLEPIDALKWFLWELQSEIEDKICEIEGSVERKDKKAIKEAKKELEKLIEEKLDDKLFEQLLLIGKKLVK